MNKEIFKLNQSGKLNVKTTRKDLNIKNINQEILINRQSDNLSISYLENIEEKIEEKIPNVLSSEYLLRKFAPKNIEDDDIKKLLKSKYTDNRLIIIDNDNELIIEIINMLKEYSIDDLFLFLSKCNDRNSIIWGQKNMNIGKVSVEREIYINKVEEMGVKGIGKCRFCLATELVFKQQQVNSGDEPMKVFVRCVSCKRSWTQL